MGSKTWCGGNPGPCYCWDTSPRTRFGTQDRLRAWGYKAYPTSLIWKWRGGGAHTHERSMMDFIMTVRDMHVT